MTTIKVCKLHNKLLNEDNVTVIFEKYGKQYVGPLFWEPDTNDTLVDVLEVQVVASSDDKDEVEMCIASYLNLCDKHGIKKYDSTASSMKHWQFINGFSDIMFR